MYLVLLQVCHELLLGGLLTTQRGGATPATKKKERKKRKVQSRICLKNKDKKNQIEMEIKIK